MIRAFFDLFSRRPRSYPAPYPAEWMSAPVFPATEAVTETVEFIRMSSTAIMPRYATPGAAGMDLHADIDASIAIGDHKLIPTNIAIKLPSDLEAQVRPRSGLALKKGITVLNSPGTIDPDYRGGIGVILYNAGSERFEIKQGDRIAQLVIAPFIRAELVQVDAFDKTARGEGGFGSTGIAA
jgi:dUTP pyrophosphatase